MDVKMLKKVDQRGGFAPKYLTDSCLKDLFTVFLWALCQMKYKFGVVILVPTHLEKPHFVLMFH